MIKSTDVRVEPNHLLRVRFNDRCDGMFDLNPLIDRNTVLTTPLRDPAFFGRVYLELGALAWPNGLELSPGSVHAELTETWRFTNDETRRTLLCAPNGEDRND